MPSEKVVGLDILSPKMHGWMHSMKLKTHIQPLQTDE